MKKVCTKCYLLLPIDRFFTEHRGGKPYVRPSCKDCDSIRKSEYVNKNRDYVNRKIREWNNKNKEHVRARFKNWYSDNRDKQAEWRKQYRETHPKVVEYEKEYKLKTPPMVLEARRLVGYFVNSGKIKKPSNCFSCKKELPKHKIQGHHEDYSKPLEVIWLCAPCHKNKHTSTP